MQDTHTHETHDATRDSGGEKVNARECSEFRLRSYRRGAYGSQDVTLHEFSRASSSRKLSCNQRRVQQRRDPRLNEITVNLTSCKSAVTIWSVLHMNAKGTAHLLGVVYDLKMMLISVLSLSLSLSVPHLRESPPLNSIHGSFGLVLSGVKARAACSN